MSNPGIVGGARPGAGRKKGGRNASTIERDAALDAYRQRVAKLTDGLLDKQKSLADGLQFLFVIRTVDGKRQKAERVENPEVIREFLDGDLENSDEEYYYITATPPDNIAINSMLDRTYGKPLQGMELTGKDGEKLEPVTVMLPPIDPK